MEDLKKVLVVSGLEVKGKHMIELMLRHQGEIVVVNNGIGEYEILDDDAVIAETQLALGREIHVVNCSVIDDESNKKLLVSQYFYDKPKGGKLRMNKVIGKYTAKKKPRKPKPKKTHRKKK